ncbi:SslE/AcfD family lipoprotein zinc metalloprotease, partial [Escherichia coli]|nr:SslE/AcfD family lipoprotein zinc metalloprotease [Escherichia coli]
YYTSSGRGVTGENGKFNFSWGETISFGIDTFELGSVRGNKSTIALTELGDEVRGANIDQLIHRYSTTGQNNTRVVPDDVRKVFAEYPNVINEIINLSLSNGATLDEGEQVVNLPNEFIEQFKTGQAKEIDTAICAKTDGCNEARWFSLTTRNVNDGQIQGVINKLWGVDTSYKSVSKFHVFHDSTNFYGSTGNARGQAVVNISNSAFPILMARNDKNYWLAFGEKRAWDKNELAYITEAPSIVQPENVTRDTATFNLPFISLGQVGEGKLMVIGNPHYNSILRCPNGYSWGGGVNSKGECTLSGDSDDMKHFMQNVLRYLSNDIWQPNTKSIMTVGTNLENVYFKKAGQVLGNSAPFAFHEDFTGITVKQLTSYGDLNPEEIPLLILNGFEYVTQWSGDPYAVPLRADTSKPKLTQQDVTDLIAYLNKGGSVLIMENVMSNLKEESASSFVRLLDAAGLSMALNKSVVNNDPQGYPDRVRQRRATGIWVYERYPAADGAQPPYTIDPNTGEVTWKYQQDNKPDDKPKLEVASWQEEVEGKQVTRYAFIDEAEYTTEESLEAAKAKIFEKFPGLQECKDSTYHYEINCLERRPGTDVPVTGGMYVPRYTQLNLDADTAKAMVQAADLGTNIQRLYQHELYFRTKGSKGERLNSVDL